MTARRITLLGLAALGLTGLAWLWIQGSRLPVEQKAEVTWRSSKACSVIYARLTNTAQIPAWSPFIGRIEPLPPRKGKPVQREHLRDGETRVALLLEQEESRVLAWVYETEVGAPLSLLRYRFIAMRGECLIAAEETTIASGPVQRMLRRLRPSDLSLKQQLTALASALGEAARFDNP